MNTKLILLAQSVTTAVIEIILLLLGAAIIGFLTAWFYQKSHYTPIIEKLEDEKEQLILEINNLNDKIKGLNDEIKGLNDKITELEKTISEQKKEIEELKKQ
ncbi:MAG TPA: hypothetical protein PLN06_06800 [Bacteroidales bacterium]|nr:hypothetical protein [Bacteroidales bacterium]HCI55935.1 hypothetical protein [Bacteroidales bacterium]HOU96318.1 hypothetical protein [Bacteroidales bacterium]HQG37076.1 hypothetical protein [Bacteroidales bacterium]HQG52159.1 hypothetical protein [Bacteroidales bacterium]